MNISLRMDRLHRSSSVAPALELDFIAAVRKNISILARRVQPNSQLDFGNRTPLELTPGYAEFAVRQHRLR